MQHVFDPAERATKELAAGVLARTFWGERMLMAVVDLEPGAEVPAHSHPHEQCGVVLEGELALTVDGVEHRLKPGDVYVIPGGVVHSARAGDRPVRVVDVFSPVREEYKY